MSVDQVAPDVPPASELVCGEQAWKNDYPWLHRAFKQTGPGARAASDAWRVRVEEKLETTLDFKVRPDGTAAVWCGMSEYEFRHRPTPTELLEGLAAAYRREFKCGGTNSWKMSIGALTPPDWRKPQPPVRVSPSPAKDSLTRALGAEIMPRALPLILIFVTVTALTLVLADIAYAVR